MIPCKDEEKYLPATVADLPRGIEGIDTIEYLVIDDGSTDRTVEVARECGVHHVVGSPNNRGLARAFETGLHACLARGADIIVNTDADNQYVGKDIPKLVQPVLAGEADIVVGERPVFSMNFLKKVFQRIGSWVVRRASRTRIPDAPSGFRAFSRDAALRLNVLSSYTYTLETIIQAGRKKMAITSVSICTNPQPADRRSRLFKNIPSYVFRSGNDILHIFMVYEPLKFFFALGGLPFLVGVALGVRFVWFYATGNGGGHVQSLILATVLLLMGFQLGILGLVADLVASNRKLSDEALYRVRKREFSRKGQREEHDGESD